MKETKDGRPGHGRKTDGCAAAAPIQYMGQQLDPCMLYAQGHILDLLQRKGAFDQTLAEIRSDYLERFGLDLIWKYPLSDDMAGRSSPFRRDSCIFHTTISSVRRARSMI